MLTDTEKFDWTDSKNIFESALNDLNTKERNKRCLYRQCFWTRPFGHIWGNHRTSYDRKCVICGKIINDDGGGGYDVSEYSSGKLLLKSNLARFRKLERIHNSLVVHNQSISPG
jgi:hypothetical protein